MGKFDKQLKYSIRKVSVGAASVVIGAFYLAMGAGVVHAATDTTTDGDASHASPSPDLEPSRPNGLTPSNYGADPAQNPGVSGKSTESTTPKEKENNDTLATNNTKPVENNETLNTAQPTEESTSANTRSRRSKREVGDAPAGGNSSTPAGTTGNNGASDSTVTERKGATVKPGQPGVTVAENGTHDPSAHLSFDDPDHTATVEDMWKIIQNMPDDFQNNERSYLRNMDTLGDELRFDSNGNVTTDPSGVKLQPGEIREISSFGGWTAIMKKDGETGKFAIGMKNKEGYFTGWYTDKDGKRQEGGMVGSNALDQIYVHEQALDRRFKYMLMLAKGRTIANKTDKAQDGSTFNIETANRDGETEALNKLPIKDKEDILQHAPNVEGFNGIEKTFKAFSTKYGSRLKIDFVTGYISDFFGSKGTYRIVVKAIKKDNSEETVYDHTINRIDGVVENEERYAQGVNLTAVNAKIKELLKKEFDEKVKALAKDRYIKENPGQRNPSVTKYKHLYPIIEKELAEKGEAIVELPIDKDKLNEKNFKNETNFKESFTRYGNELNGLLKLVKDKEVQKNSPTWLTTSEKYPDNTNLIKSRDSDRVYKLLDFILPTAKKIIYHGDTDQLELVTDSEKVKTHRAELKAKLTEKEALLETTTDETQKTKLKQEISGLKSAIGSTNAYTYMEARNGKEAKILGSNMYATRQPDKSELTEDEYNKIRTNALALEAQDGLKKFTNHFVEKDNVSRDGVISDEKLSEEITKAIDGDKEKLGKGGYFSTGDIPLGKDVVSYKVQVFAENEKRVGVNMQSPRLQYNLPILADFSVIQDTVEPSKEVARRIITKLKEQGKITEEQEKKIKEEIEKSKKTSEVKSAMSGDVTVRYVDTDGNNLPITDADAKKAGEKTDNGYLVRKDVLIGTDYDVHSKKVPYFKATNGKNYALRSVGGGLETSSDALNGSITKKNTVITFVYEETTVPPTGKGVVHFKKQVSDTATEALTGYDDITLSGNEGDTFSSTDVDTKITELKKAGYEIVEDTFTTGDKTIDSTTDEDGQEPSQVYNVIVREKVVEVTEPPTPNTPVDPTVPDGPKWPTEGLKESDLKKEVTRTITYVKKETADGPEIENAKPTKKQTAHFKRSATYNLVTKVVTPGEWESTDKKLGAVPTEKLDGYVADKATVEEVETNVNSTDLDKKVVYTKLGSWVPKVPGVETPTPLPYPNHPTDPTKPGEPTDPNAPVIPYVPGYTPSVGGTPLVPKVPNDPTQGYIPPAVPTEPGTNTDITYVADPQKAVVKVFNTTTGTEVELPAEKVSIDNGTTDAVIPTTDLNTKIADLEKRGYVVENKDLLKDQKFDKDKDPTDGDPTQVFKLLVKERTVTVTEPKNPNEPVDPDKPEGPKWPATGLAKSDLEKEVTRTITYVKKETADGPEIADAKPTVTQTAHFKRSATYNLVTKVVTPGEWESTDKKLGAVPTEKLDGYVADKATVEEVETNVNSTDLDKKVVYTKLGSWVPKVPGEETPTPLPYPNHPTDPTKPGDPTDPNTPNVPVIPYVPGYTPSVGGTPLVPKVPNDPTQGYIPPAVPTEPGTNTDITYVADPQKAVVKVFNTTTGTEVELPAEKVSIDNGTTDAVIPTTDLNTKIADLEKRGYVVENKDLLKDQKFDKEKDPTDGDPTQVFKLLVKERTVTVTEPKNPNEPVDPDKPEGPKWPAEGLKESDLKKEVTRTITYVKKETADAQEEPSGKDPVTQTAHFKRSATYNLVTKVVTPGNWESADKELAKVDTPTLTGYVADKASVDKVETNENSTGLDQKVVYTKLGSWVPRLPEGVTPPTGTDMTPKPYPNHPTDPTKPGDPTDPNTPNVPVIPYVPGYTPKIGETPLQPKVPNDPTQGYIPPAVPTEPGTNTDITYVADPQKAVVKVFNTTTGTEVEIPEEKVSIDNGTTDSAIPTDSVTAKIADLEKRGYVVENKDLLKDQKFDKDKDPTDGDPTQVFKLKVHEKLVPVTPPTDDRPITPGTPIDPTTPVDPNNPNDPTIPRWTDELIKKLDVKKEVIRTINYVDEEGNKISKPSTDKVTFTRESKINVVTGEITYGDWKAVGGDSTFDKVSSPVVKGYILKDPAQKEVAERKGITPTVANQTIEVVYKKLGSWIPKVPGVETPTPLPYPNHPTDPTKPGEPTDPNTPNVPVIPYVPGYTPKIGETPLQPKVPNDPTKGYIPPVPTEPGKDTPIEYVKVPNTPSPEEPVKPTPESNHITIWLDENGKPLKPEQPGTHEAGNIPGYRFITTTTKDGVTIHRFEKISPVEPNNPVPQKPITPIRTPQDLTTPTPESQIPTPNTPEANTPTSETNRREELPNTGTESNATLASAGIMTLLAGLGLGFFKKKEEDESE